MNRRSFNLVSLFNLFIFTLAGCTGATEPKLPELIPAMGTVSVDDKPAAGVTVRFVPKTGTPGNGSSAVTDEKGSFVLNYINGAAGIPPGAYDVTFSKFEMPDGSAVSQDIQPESVGAKQVIPNQYTNVPSGKEANVSAESDFFEFKL
ncbi:MAG TPA: hypothetical protein DIW81_00040 [Planctomycetaceae bacterium]|nr:hypothetical protein [Rubinisphaera sp.]HCS49978.1 hypothetical protein [Planctomycetaceae bacterium]|tara:strand:- start:1222 stop:1665 length:444 start_codon:yes stop_codon:yes gene_type:complete